MTVIEKKIILIDVGNNISIIFKTLLSMMLGKKKSESYESKCVLAASPYHCNTEWCLNEHCMIVQKKTLNKG